MRYQVSSIIVYCGILHFCIHTVLRHENELMLCYNFQGHRNSYVGSSAPGGNAYKHGHHGHQHHGKHAGSGRSHHHRHRRHHGSKTAVETSRPGKYSRKYTNNRLKA